MDNTYTRQEVARLIAKERDRAINIAYKKGDEMERLSRQRPALKSTLRRAIDAVDDVFRKIVGVKMDPKDDYEQQLVRQVSHEYFPELAPLATKELEACVFPSQEQTISTVIEPEDPYGGAHRYVIRDCLGFKNGETKYVDSFQVIQFVEKRDDGSTTPGLQSEQLVLALIDRHKKLNARFPSPHNEKMIRGLEMFLEASRERVEERMSRGVMGELKK